ncbi:LysR family transcriptional regulator [Flavisphingomonas formosensis]|uniref:LysR family transcriptional regulator n=1 Tax=Flavisphingomonas formosensis TaxID=861534 RepID=UPI0012FAAA29|nr:LysR substrate-binding domain-containing protein [Sphingomonas formosensis]
MDLDLNLLRIFDTLMEQRNATRAAERLSLTQSAISHALGRLRRQLDDPLFVRSPHGLQPTARAIEIAGGVREGLVRLQNALAPSLFDPAHAVRRFTLSAGTYFCSLLVPPLVERLRTTAPGISLRVFPISDDLVAALDGNAIDIALGAFSNMPGRLIVEPLFEEEMVWIAARSSPLVGRTVSAEEIALHRQVVIVTGGVRTELGVFTPIGDTFRSSASQAVTEALHGGESAMAVYDSRTAIATVARTDLIALVARRAVQQYAEADQIAILRTATAPTQVSLSMLWHATQREDPGLAWLRTAIGEIANDTAANI